MFIRKNTFYTFCTVRFINFTPPTLVTFNIYLLNDMFILSVSFITLVIAKSLPMATRQKHSATLSSTMATVATETHSDARWWPLTRWEAGECNQKGRLCWGIWGIIWCRTKPLASWGGGQERERKREGHRGEGSGENGGERPFLLALFRESGHWHCASH